MKFQKLGKHFSKFYVYGNNPPFFADNGVFRAPPNSIFLKSALRRYQMTPKSPIRHNLYSPYDKEYAHLVLTNATKNEIDIHIPEVPPGTVYK